jgi:NADH dehydrogenase
LITGKYLQVLEEMEGIRVGGLSMETRETAKVA